MQREGWAVIDRKFQKMKPTFAAVSSLLAIASFLAAAVFVVLHAEHDCVGDGCGVCAQIYVISEAMKRFSSGPDFTSPSFAACIFILMSLCLPGKICPRDGDTPVRAKVRLNN
jgi:hypothetical protein